MNAHDLCQAMAVPQCDSVTQMFLVCSKRIPDQPAVRSGDQSWSYRELAQASVRIARRLVSQGLKQGEVVAIAGDRSFGLIASMMGVLLSGGVLLCIDPSLPEARRRLMLEEAGARLVLLCENETRSLDSTVYPSLRVMRILPSGAVIQGGVGDGATGEVALADPLPDDPAYVFFTSGTTGIPKGILGRHKGLAHFLAWERAAFEVGPGDRVAQLTNLSFDVVLRDVFLPLVSGATICLLDGGVYPYEVSVVKWLRRERITILHIVASVAQVWLDGMLPGPPLASLRVVLFAGEPLTEVLVRRWRESIGLSAQIVNLYGPTETTLAKCFYRVPAHPSPGVQPIGEPIPDTQALIMADDLRICRVNEPGEIVLRTPFRSLGYLRASPSDRRGFIVNPHRDDPHDLLYRTGDLGFRDERGLLHIRGRLDDQVKINGVRIEPLEIASVVAEHPGVRRCVVLAPESAVGQKRLVAFFFATDHRPSTQELRAHVRRKLPEYMVPSEFVLIESFPLTPNGKIDRAALLKFGLKQAPNDGSTAPANGR